MFNRARWNLPRIPTGAGLALTLAAGLLITALPRRALEPLRAGYAWAVEPGRLAADSVSQFAQTNIRRWRDRGTTTEKLAALRQQVEQLTARNNELESVLARPAPGVNAHSIASASADELPPLIRVDCLAVHVLGRHACAVLATDQIIRAGQDQGLSRDSLVLADSALRSPKTNDPKTSQPTMIDGGEDAGLTMGDLTLVGRRVYGRVVKVGAQTSTVRRADQPGYRDVVEIAPAQADTAQSKIANAQAAQATPPPALRGILEGVGEQQARVRMVSAQQVVSVGDLVLTTEQQGVSPQPLVYGRVARVERAAGAPHWDIWVDLAAGSDAQDRLLVLRARRNPAREAVAFSIGQTSDREERR